MNHPAVTRRTLLAGTGAIGAATWVGGGAVSARAESMTSQVDRLRRKFFEGPVADVVDLDSLDPARRPDSAQIGGVHQFQFADERPWFAPATALPFAVAAGLKWMRSAFLYSAWDWPTNQPTDLLEDAVTAMAEHGIRPLLTLNNTENIGTDKETSGTVDMALAAAQRWGPEALVFMFENEPGNGPWKNFYGGNYAGGEWIPRFAQYAEAASTQIKSAYPDLKLINSIQTESPAIAQLQQSSPVIDGVCMHHYTWRHNLPPEYSPRTNDQKFPAFVTSDEQFVAIMRDYRRQAGMLLNDPEVEVWMTEMGIPSLTLREIPPDTLEPMSRVQQAKNTARMLVQGLLTADKSFVYQLIDQGHSAERAGDNFGMVADDLTPKEGFFVLGRISALTGGQATPDQRFQAVVTGSGRDLPLYVKEVPINAAESRHVLIKEEIRIERFTTADGRGLIAFWSTHPPREDFVPRHTSFVVDTDLGRSSLLVDPMTGRSEVLRTRPGQAGSTEFQVDVVDYPKFILSPQS